MGMARLQLLGVAVLWLLVAAVVLRSRSRLRRSEDRHWLMALETLRHFDTRY